MVPRISIHAVFVSGAQRAMMQIMGRTAQEPATALQCGMIARSAQVALPATNSTRTRTARANVTDLTSPPTQPAIARRSSMPAMCAEEITPLARGAMGYLTPASLETTAGCVEGTPLVVATASIRRFTSACRPTRPFLLPSVW